MQSECERVGKLVSDYVDGALRPAEMASVSAHLDACPDCRREAERLRLLVGKLSGLSGTQVPYDFWPAVADRIAATKDQRGFFRRRVAAFAGWRVVMVPTVAAAAALLIFVAHPAHKPPHQTSRVTVAETTAEYKAYMQAYTSFRSQQTLSDRAAIAAAAQLQHNQSSP